MAGDEEIRAVVVVQYDFNSISLGEFGVGYPYWDRVEVSPPIPVRNDGIIRIYHNRKSPLTEGMIIRITCRLPESLTAEGLNYHWNLVEDDDG